MDSQGQNQLNDTVQAIVFSNESNSTTFAAGGWDGKLRVYEINSSSGDITPKLLGCVAINEPILAICWVDQESILVGTADCGLLGVHTKTGKAEGFLRLKSPIIGLHRFEKTSIIAIIETDGRVSFYSTQKLSIVGEILSKYRILCSDANEECIVLGLAENYFGIIPLTRGDPEAQYLSNPLNSPISSISIKSNALNILLTSVDGFACYVAIKAGTMGLEMVKRWHKKLNEKVSMGASTLYPFNCSTYTNASIPKDDTCILGGGDGMLMIIDTSSERQTKRFSISGSLNVTALGANSNGTYFAYATGYDWAIGFAGLFEFNKKDLNIRGRRIERFDLSG